LLYELSPDGTLRADPIQAQDVARWRKAERGRLLEARSAFTEECRSQQALAIAFALDQILATVSSIIVSVFWPIRAELDLREWMRTLAQKGIQVALPVAVALG
jgi:5-formyltetrahydrofolate cyclo-ligase